MVLAVGFALMATYGVVAAGQQVNGWIEDREAKQVTLQIAVEYFLQAQRACSIPLHPITLVDAFNGLATTSTLKLPEDAAAWRIELKGAGSHREWIKVYRQGQPSQFASALTPHAGGDIGSELFLAFDPSLDCSGS